MLEAAGCMDCSTAFCQISGCKVTSGRAAAKCERTLHCITSQAGGGGFFPTGDAVSLIMDSVTHPNAWSLFRGHGF